MKKAMDIGVLLVALMRMGAVKIELEPTDFRQVGRQKADFLGTPPHPAVLLPPPGFALALRRQFATSAPP